MSMYTCGIRKILSPSLTGARNRDDFFMAASHLGYKLAAWNNEVWLQNNTVWVNTTLLVTDFKVSIEIDEA